MMRDDCDEERNSTVLDRETDRPEDRLSLLDLPIEILLHICSFLDASTIVHGLSLVCKRFNGILSDDLSWKMRISKIWPNTGYPILPTDEEEEYFWKLSCVAIERQASLWKNKEDTIEKIPLKSIQESTMDALLLMNGGNICISGGRDRSLVYWKFPTKEGEDETSTTFINYAHDGWIWDLASMENTIYSCSWDQTVKAWTLSGTGLANLTTYEMVGFGALLCVAACPALRIFATGSLNKTVLVYDSRMDRTPIQVYQAHTRAVLRLAMNSNFILSASEDKSVSIWDHRMRKILKSVPISRESFPMSLSVHGETAIYVGDSNANLHVLDPKRDFEPVKSIAIGHRKGITGVRATLGCIITSSMDGTIRISSPTDPPKTITTLRSTYDQIASMDYLNDVLAVSGTEGIEVWRPRVRCT